MDSASETSARRPSATGPLVLAALVGASLAGAMFAGDGSGSGGTLRVGGGALLLLTAALVMVAFGKIPAPRIGRTGAVLLGSFVLLVAWLGVTVWWSIVPDRSWDSFNKSVAYVAFLGLGFVLAAVGRAMAARLAASLLSIVIGTALVWALVTKAVPTLAEDERVARLNEPVDHWNALALLADVAIVLGLWLATTSAHRFLVRVAGALLVYVATLALLLTLSRAGVVVGVGVIALWLALTSERVQSGLVLVAAAGPALLVAGWAFTRDALTEDLAPRADRVSDGAVFGVLALVGAAVVLVLVSLGFRRPLGVDARRRAGRWLIALAAVLIVVAARWSDRGGRRRGLVGPQVRRGGQRSEPLRVARRLEPPLLVGGGGGRLPRARAGGRGCRDLRDRAQALPPECRDGPAAAQRPAPAAGGRRRRSARPLRRRDPRRVRGLHLRRATSLGHRASGGRGARGCTGRVPRSLPRRLQLGLPRGDRADDGRAGRSRGRRARGGGAAQAADSRHRDGRARGDRARLVLVPATRRPGGAAVDTRARSRRPGAGTRRGALGAPLQSVSRPTRSSRKLGSRRSRASARAPSATTSRRSSSSPTIRSPGTRSGSSSSRCSKNLCAAYRFLNDAYTLDPKGNQWTKGSPLDVARDAVNEGGCAPGS